ncbi:ribonuclease T [Novosphingobium sp. TH158]|uniref:ribonuclease T2 family protein n=1 Tax=Novosphingobium sp. TH158 TaxID=2067455 RepID=UPI0020B15380|nr:ribonuclease T [Novosphingobium sp. TH158]
MISARIAAMVLLASATPAFAQAYQCRVPQRIEPPAAPRQDGPERRTALGGYVLAASWSPEYCNTNRRAGGSMQCSGSAGRFGFILHGLWPEAPQGAPPQWCSSGIRPSVEELRRNLCMTPSPELLEHEWAKHGSCMAKTPESYFATARGMWNRIAWPDADRLSRKPALTAGDLRQAFIAANPGWTPGSIAIRLSQSGWLREVHLCLDSRRKPARCSRPGARDGQAMKIWRGL